MGDPYLSHIRQLSFIDDSTQHGNKQTEQKNRNVYQ